jgi:uncharacterized protein (TIGR02118 family)
MEKIVTLLRRPAAREAEAFTTELLRGLRSSVAKTDGRLKRCIVNLADAAAKEGVLDPTRPPPAYDAALETWWEAPIAESEPLLAAIAEVAGTCWSYRVYEVIQKEYARDWPLGERSPGIKGVFTVGRRADLTHEQFARHWHAGHGPLAVKHHVGLCKYVQNVTLDPLTRGAPDFDGFATLHFPSAAAMRERFYDSPEGRKLIGEDVKRFIGSPSMQMNCSEYVLHA